MPRIKVIFNPAADKIHTQFVTRLDFFSRFRGFNNRQAYVYGVAEEYSGE
jgi:hypothetical protein